MKIFDKIKERFPSIFGEDKTQGWAVIAKVGREYELRRGDGEYLGSFKRKGQATIEAQARGLLLFD